MAINLLLQYPGQVDPATTEFPYGEPRNITAPGDGLGTPWEVAIIKDIVGLQQALLKSDNITPSGTPDEFGDSEYLKAITGLILGRANQFVDTGVANAYVLNPSANQEGASEYYEGLTIKFTPGNNNTGAVTVNVNGLGILPLTSDDPSFSALEGGELINGRRYTMIFNSIGFFQLVRNLRQDHCVIDSAGTGLTLPSGWSVTKPNTGVYDIAQTTAIAVGAYSKLSVIVTPRSVSGKFYGVVSAITQTNIRVNIFDATTDALADADFSVMINHYD